VKIHSQFKSPLQLKKKNIVFPVGFLGLVEIPVYQDPELSVGVTHYFVITCYFWLNYSKDRSGTAVLINSFASASKTNEFASRSYLKYPLQRSNEPTYFFHKLFIFSMAKY